MIEVGLGQGISCHDRVFMSRQRLAKTTGFMSQQSILCRDRVWPRPRGPCVVINQIVS